MNGRLQKWLVSVIFASDLISDRKYSCVDYLCVLIEFWSVTSQVFKCFGEFHPTGSASAYLIWSSVIFLEGSIPWLQLVQFCLAFFTSRSMIIHLKETACILYSVLPNDISMFLFFVSVKDLFTTPATECGRIGLEKGERNLVFFTVFWHLSVEEYFNYAIWKWLRIS